MTLNHDVLSRQPLHDELARKMAEWEAKHGPVVTQPVLPREVAPVMYAPDGAAFALTEERLAAARRKGGVAGSRHRQV